MLVLTGCDDYGWREGERLVATAAEGEGRRLLQTGGILRLRRRVNGDFRLTKRLLLSLSVLE